MDIAQMLKSQTDSYLAAYQAGYAAGFARAKQEMADKVNERVGVKYAGTPREAYTTREPEEFDREACAHVEDREATDSIGE